MAFSAGMAPTVLLLSTDIFGFPLASGSLMERALLLALFLFFGVLLLVMLFMLLRK